jgi:restriction system protein
MLVLAAVILFTVFLLVRAAVSTAARHPDAAILAAAGLAAVAGLAARLWWLRRAERAAAHAHLLQVQAARAREIETYHAMNAREFELALAYLCVRDGCSDVRVVGGAGDLGADVVATTPQGQNLVIQAKRYRVGNKVTGPDLQKFGGTCFGIHGAHVAAVVTTSEFTRQALAYAAQMGIRVYDNDALAGWASCTGPAPWAL